MNMNTICFIIASVQLILINFVQNDCHRKFKLSIYHTMILKGFLCMGNFIMAANNIIILHDSKVYITGAT